MSYQFRPHLFALVILCLCLGPRAVAGAVMPIGDLVGDIQTYTVEKGDSLSAVARHFDIGAVELLAANPSITSSRISIGQILTIPVQHILPSTERQGIVINLDELRLFYFEPDGSIQTFPISIGREGWRTPSGSTEVVLKRKDPVWIPPASIRAEDPTLPAVVPAGPNNPLGQYALNLGWSGYRIHGTNQPSSIGKPVSHGCIRMYPEDIAILFNAVPVGTAVTVVDAPIKLGWRDGALYIEVTPNQVQARAIAAHRKAKALDAGDPSLSELEVEIYLLESQGEVIDHDVVDAAIARHDGIPVIIAGKRQAAESGH